ncbi:MAG: hypothetical protein VXW89_01110, partial [Candidatus Thermoplasmatota archaeon]|nr:hypothetical protein [Candidatus Thermoplasmatota archaeon]
MGQRQHSLILALTLIFTLIGSVQAETQQEVITQAEGLDPHDGIHYFAGTTSTFQISIKNTGLDDVSIEINPSCMATFQIINQNSEIVYDLEDHRLCPNQKRGETLTSAEVVDVGEISYDWTNGDEILPEGIYVIRIVGGIETIPLEVEIDLKHQQSLPSNLYFEADFASFSMNSETSTPNDVLIMGAKIYNSG